MAQSQTVRTSLLLRQLSETHNLHSFLQRNEHHMLGGSLAEYLRSKCAEKQLVREQVILSAGIERTYGHQIFRGLRNPSRDKLLTLALCMGMTLPEVQHLLLLGQKSQLHPKVRRDTVFIYGFTKGLAVEDVAEMLVDLQLRPMEEGTT